MAEESGDDSEKTEEPSQYRLDEFRKRGEVAYSRELNSVLVLCGTLLALIISGVFIMETMAEFIQWTFTLDPQMVHDPKKFQDFIQKTAMVGLKCSAPCLVTALCLSVLSQITQIGFLYAPEVLQLKFERINPINGFQKLFSKKAISEAIKGILKFTIIIIITYAVFKKNISSMGGFLHLDFFQSFIHGKEILVKLGFSILLGLFVVAIADFAWEKWTYLNKLKLTKQQAKQELKEKEGNPEIKNRIRAIQRSMARKRMMANVPKADVIVTNPTHISVALKYDPKTMISPIVLAKGADVLALKIRELAKDNEIPIVENIILARTLYKTVKVNNPVPRELYKAVAEVIGFVYKLKRKKQQLLKGIA